MSVPEALRDDLYFAGQGGWAKLGLKYTFHFIGAIFIETLLGSLPKCTSWI